MTMVVDRLEEPFAVLELSTPDGEVLYKNIPLAWLPADVCEGDVLCKAADGYVIDTAGTEKRRAAAAKRLQRLQHTDLD